MGRKALPLKNRYGKWTVLSKVRLVKWVLCQCSCGRIQPLGASNLIHGTTTQCRSCASKKTSTTHGYSKTPTYVVWKNMKRRCNDPNHNRWERYGGRGISVCEKWMNSFESFLRDVGERPSVEYSLDRKNNDGNYEPNNVRWATRSQQMKNRSPYGT